MATRKNQSEDVERKPKQKQGKRAARRKDRQAMKSQRVGALDRFAAQKRGDMAGAPPEVQARRDQMQAKMDQMGGFQTAIGADGRGGPMPPQTLPPQPQPQPMVEPQPITQDLGMTPQPMPGVPAGVEGQPQVVGQGTSLAQPQPQALPPEMVGGQDLLGEPMQIDPNTGEMVPGAPQPQPMGEPQPIAAGPNTMPPVTPEEAQAQADLDAAQAQGTVFNVQSRPVAPPEQFYDNTLGQGGQVQGPRDLERLRRKRLALLNPRVQQLRPQGRGLPQVRYGGGAPQAFPGATELPPTAGWGGWKAQPNPAQQQIAPGVASVRRPFRA